MTTQEQLNELRRNPSRFVSLILANNPEAVAQNAISMGLFTYAASPQDIVSAINELLRQNNQAAVEQLLSVPFNPASGNESDLYFQMFSDLKAGKIK